MESDRLRSSQVRSAVYGTDEHLNTDKETFQDQLHNLLTDQRFLYLKNVSPLAFYELLGKVDQRKHLQDELSIPLIGLSPEEKARRMATVLGEIDAKTNAQRQEVGKARLSQSGMIAGAVGAVICLICDAATYAGAFALLGSIFAAYGGLQPLVDLFTKDQDALTLYQVFYEISEKERKELEAKID